MVAGARMWDKIDRMVGLKSVHEKTGYLESPSLEEIMQPWSSDPRQRSKLSDKGK